MKYTKYIDIKNYIDNANGCKLITTENEFYLLKKEQNKNAYEVKLNIKCACGEKFITSFDKFKNRNKQQCTNCGRKITGKKLKYTYDFVKKIVSKKGYELLDNVYYDNKQKLTLRDSSGYLYYICLSKLLYNRIPNKFNILNPYTIDNIKLWCIVNDKNLQLISNVYYGSKNKLEWKCLECNEIFEANWSNIISNKGCPFCAESKGEQKISSILKSNNIYYIPQKNLKDLLD